jgi:hypothetical protein
MRPETLEAAGIVRAGSVILGSGRANGAEVIRAALALNPGARVLARAPYLRDVPSLKEAGASPVYSREGEVRAGVHRRHPRRPWRDARTDRPRAHGELFGDA